MVDSPRQPSGGFVLEMNGDRALLAESPRTEPGGQPLLPLQSIGGSSSSPAPSSTPKFSTEWGVSVPPSFYDWLATFIGGKATLKKVKIFAADFNGESRIQLDLGAAQIVQAELPALDAASTQLARIWTVIQAPPAAWTKSAPGNKVVPSTPPPPKWTCGQFHLTITGLSTTKVSAIEAIVFNAPGKCGDFAITVHPLEIQGFNTWLKTKEPRQASLIYYRASLQPACTLNFLGLRIVSIDVPLSAPTTVRGTTQSGILKYVVHLTPGSASFVAG